MIEKKIIINNEESKFIYINNILKPVEIIKLEKYLDSLKFKDGKIGKKNISRLQLWFHNNDKYFCDKWLTKYPRWMSNTYSQDLLFIQDKINRLTRKILNNDKIIFNSCLINKYRHGNDCIKPHRDTPLSFGHYPVISGLSVKSQRKIVITPSDPIWCDPIEFELEPNSLFIMTGASQKYFTHEIPISNSNLERYSLTFRNHLG